MSKQLTPADVIAATGLSRGTVIGLFRDLDFPSYKIGRRWFVDEKDFAEWRNQRKEEKTAEVNYISNPILDKWKKQGHLKGGRIETRKESYTQTT